MGVSTQTRADELLHSFFSSDNESQTSLNLSNCALTELPPSLYTYIKSNPKAAARLQLLNLAHNKLTTLPNYLSLLPNLRILFLLANNFRTIPPVVAELPACYMLSFKSNQLSGELYGSSLPRNITWLILTSNALTALSPDFPRRCARVRKLMLANNQLSTLPPDFHLHMTDLELLRLSNNRFDAFPQTVLHLPRLAWLALGGNPCTGGTVTSANELPSALRVDDVDAQYDVRWSTGIGAGTSGCVYPGVHRRSRRAVAVKRFKGMVGSDGAALDEVAITLAASGVDGIVRAVGYAEDRTAAREGRPGFLLISDLVPGNPKTIAGPPSFDSCTRSVYDDGIALSIEDAQKIVDVVSCAVEGLLVRGISHGDVYGHNVLVGDKLEDSTLPVVLGDLGAAWRFTEAEAEGVRRIERRAVAIFSEEIMNRVRT